MATIDLTIPLSLGDTIGSVLHAIIQAQVQSAQSTIQFIQEVGTVESTGEGDEDQALALRQVRFNYQKLDENAKLSEFTLEVPLLSMVEIPLINVKSAKIAFQYEVTSTTASQSTTTSVTSPSIPSAVSSLAITRIPASLKGKVQRSSRTDTQQKGGMNIEIEIEKSDWPIGIERLYEILELSSNSLPTNNDDNQ